MVSSVSREVDFQPSGLVDHGTGYSASVDDSNALLLAIVARAIERNGPSGRLWQRQRARAA